MGMRNDLQGLKVGDSVEWRWPHNDDHRVGFGGLRTVVAIVAVPTGPTAQVFVLQHQDTERVSMVSQNGMNRNYRKAD